MLISLANQVVRFTGVSSPVFTRYVTRNQNVLTRRFYIPCHFKVKTVNQSLTSPVYCFASSSAHAPAKSHSNLPQRKLTSKQFVYQIYAHVVSKFKSPAYKPQFHTTRTVGTRHNSFCSVLELQWPEPLKFEGTGHSKSVAEEIASKLALQKLQDLKALSDDFKPLIEVNPVALESGPVSESHAVTLDELNNLEDDFPMPKNTLINAYRRVCNHTGDANLMPKPHFLRVGKGSHALWTCSYTLQWPKQITLQARAATRAHADRLACFMAIHWLQSIVAMDRKGDPVLFTPEEIQAFKQSLQAPFPLSLDQELRNSLRTLINDFKDIDSLVKTALNGAELSLLSEEDSLEAQEAENELEETLGLAPATYHEERVFFDWENRVIDLPRRSQQMWQDLKRRTSSPVINTLPISNQREAIVNLLETNRVVVLSGDTGCGKSTQVPQFILDAWTERHQGSECNIIVTQPRRLAAIALARRIAHERGEPLGKSIGYQIRLESVLPKNPGSVLFCSTGILLRKLQNSSDLSSLTHIIVDEVHERDVMTDFLLIVLKDLQQTHPHLKILLMSASLNSAQISRYFSHAPTIHVPGFVHLVKEHYLPEVLATLASSPGLRVPTWEPSTSTKPMINKDLVVNLIRYIDTKKPDGSILCFLPGWQDIDLIYRRLKEFYPSDSAHWLLPVHSRLSVKEQERIFNPAPPGVRKIVLATNIAETSLTINDVVYVINPGIHKETRYNPEQNTSLMENQWVSAANVQQRKGRAGRVQPGECYHLFPRNMLAELPAFAKAEILRIPLEQVVMDVKAFKPDVRAVDFLERALDPPGRNAIARAVLELQQLGALDDAEQLTPLGQHMTGFTTHPRIAKALIYAAIFGCVKPLLSIAAWLTSGREVMAGRMEVRATIRNAKQKYHASSDHLAVVELLQQWRDNPSATCWQANNVNAASLRFITGIQRLLAEHLKEANLITSSELADNPDMVWNQWASNEQLTLAVLLAGLSDRVLRTRQGKLVKSGIDRKEIQLLTSTGRAADIFGDSVNGADLPADSFLSYFHGMQLPERRCFGVRDASIVHPLAVLLFAGQRLKTWRDDSYEEPLQVLSVDGEPQLRFSCPPSEAKLLAEWRRCIQSVTDFLLQNPSEEAALTQRVRDWHTKSVELIIQSLSSGQC